MSWLGLLSPKELLAFAPEEYRLYIQGLYEKRTKRGRAAAKAQRKEYSARRNAKGSLIITIRRNPKNLTRSEVTEIAQQLGAEISEITDYLAKKKILIVGKEDSGAKQDDGAGTTQETTAEMK